MAEGAQLPWKMQKVDASRGPAGNYSSLSSPLPKPPKGMKWEQDTETHEWQLIEEVTLAPDNSLKGAEINNNNKGPLEHIVLPTDTLAGICIRYKVTPTQLRQANRFSGSNLSLAPSKLIIPVNGIIDPTLHARSDDTRALITALPQLSYKDAQLYLKMAKWDLKAAMEDAKADLEWEAMHQQEEEEEEKQQPHAVVHEAIPLLNSTAGIM
eukprot:CAMPEP_0172415080 /NCGR_PEP_ID=MMETSP1064-20121228/1610_1 /TAXON_ID=202472 /ORGANISM="Aulacoseira subarctica , Strain CCAP 1002/5" /LENGTH=210 /DNA_ID=CAMNT_0013151977 /DNA_START=103 /DNA_END=735 /DNA_ORIENTATION=+